MSVIETGKNLTYADPQTRTETRHDPIGRDLRRTVGNGWWTWYPAQARVQHRTVTVTYEWSVELVENGSGTPLTTASFSDTQTITSGCETLQVLPGKDVVKRWKQTVDYGSWTPSGISGWEDTEPLPVGWERDV